MSLRQDCKPCIKHIIPVDKLGTQKLFWRDPYLDELETHVTSVRGSDIEVAETIFYAFSGGQESDTGYINDRPVLEARKTHGTIIYRLPEDHGLSPGDRISMRIDWQRRYRLMRLHFAAEVILELVYHSHPGIQKIGAHISADKARIDFAFPQNLSPQFAFWQQQAQAIIDADHPVTSAFSNEAQQHRYWEVPGFAKVPCGGTHLRFTSEVGGVRLKRKNIGKDKERIEIYLNDES